MKTAISRLALFAILLGQGMLQTAFSQDASLETCRAIKERIEHYSELRRRGGSASDMTHWKRQRRQNESEFRRLSCRHHGSDLR